MRIDRPDLPDGPGESPAARDAQPPLDKPDAADKDKGRPARADDAIDSSPASADGTLRSERAEAYRAKVDAVYRQYAMDHNDGHEVHELCAAAAGTSDGSPATAPSSGDSIGNGGGTHPPAGDTSPDPEGDDPEGMNGGLGELVNVNAKDRAAGLLAERIGGEASVRFANGPDNEFDAVSSEYVAQAKPAEFTLNKAFRDQAKVTFEVAIQSGRTPYFQFDGPPGPGVIQALSRYAERYGIEPVIDLTPQGEAHA